ncbi:unnamed protein product [Cuscuta campestris]|uniref:Reverse transcriptase domain-containing protein n=1 Tax=Cuscuta campestris TaxID=132261 RepID=A0A484LWZ3_9ASTE|nr:unnamed protein product [Cuscuta campestris]
MPQIGKVVGLRNGNPSVVFTGEEQHVAQELQYAVVGRSNISPPLNDLHRILHSIGFKAFSIKPLSRYDTLFIFQFEHDYQRFLLRRTWKFGKADFYVFKWSPDYSSSTDCPVIPVWVSIFNVPLHLFHPPALYTLASCLGRPIKPDERTLFGKNTSRARMCIEIDFSNPVPQAIHLRLGARDFNLPLTIEKPPYFCRTCKLLGHKESPCKKRFVAGKVHTGDTPMVANGDLDWTIVKRKHPTQKPQTCPVPVHYWKIKDPSQNPPAANICQAGTSKNTAHSPTLNQTLAPLSPTPSQSASLIPKPHITSIVHPNTTPNICSELLNLMDLDPTPTLPSGSLDDTTSLEVINHDPTTTILNNLGFPLHDTVCDSEEELDIHCHSEGDDEPYIKGNLEPFILKPTLKCAQAEEESMAAEIAFDERPTETNRETWSKAKAKLILATNREVEYWKQKANVRWMEKGDANSKYFHSLVKGRKHKLSIKHIKSSEGRNLTQPKEIQTEAVNHFTKIYTKSSVHGLEEITQFIPNVITEEENNNLTIIPTLEEVRAAVWDLDPHSTSGPDGYTWEFFRKTWHILGQDLHKAAQEFFLGIPTPKAYEMHHALDRKTNGGNLIIKVDMAKAFDKLSWEYLEAILSAFGFSSKVITLLMSNLKATSLSILINGQPAGFFPMERGIKQGDPLSPLLYILATEGLTRALNHHLNNSYLTPFNAGQVSRISHLAYVDDLIIFANGHYRNVLRLKGIINTYLQASG